MTHVVAEACIRCKYDDYVGVCPVNRYGEKPNFLNGGPRNASTTPSAFRNVWSTPAQYTDPNDPCTPGAAERGITQAPGDST
jgi:hypothetical protein